MASKVHREAGALLGLVRDLDSNREHGMRVKVPAEDRTPDLFTGKTRAELLAEAEAEERSSAPVTQSAEKKYSVSAGGVSIRREGSQGTIWIIFERAYGRHEFMMLKSEAIALKRLMEGMKE